MLTTLPKIAEIKRAWHEIDASKLTLGRLASRVATLLRGKHKVVFTPHMDVGDFVVVKNSSRVKLTGRKILQKHYFRFSGYPGGIRSVRLKDMLERNPERVIFLAVSGMLGKNRLRKQILKRLKIVPGDKHNFAISKKI